MAVWQKVASVTVGGKPYFWFKKSTHYLAWVVWDRYERKWRAEVRATSNNQLVFRYFNTAEAGKKGVSSLNRR